MSRFLSGLVRALSGLLLMVLCLGAGAGSIISSSHPPPQPIWQLQNWIEWYQTNPQNAVALLISAFGTAAGLALSAYQIWFSRAAREAELRILKGVKTLEIHIGDQIEDVQQIQKETAAALGAQIQDDTRQILARLDPQPGRLYTIPGFSYPLPEMTKVFGHKQFIDDYCDRWLDDPARRLFIYGSPNIGKSTVARAILRDPRSKERFGIRRYELQCDTILGLNRPSTVSPEALPRAMAAAWFGISGGTAKQLTSALMSMLSEAPAAILVDNFETLLYNSSAGIRLESREWIDCLGSITNLWMIVGVQGRDAPSTMSWELSTEVAPLDPEDAIKLFCSRSKVDAHASDPHLREILEAVDYVPYPVILLGRIALNSRNLDALYSLWEEKGIAALLRSKAGNRDEAMEVSYDFAIRCLNEAAVPALRTLAWLPAGAASADLAYVLPNGRQAESLLYMSALVDREGSPERLRMLKPLRDYVLRTRGPQPEEKAGAVQRYLDLAATLSDVSAPISGKIVSRLSAEFANLLLALDEGLKSAWPTTIDAARGLGRFSAQTGIGREESIRFLTAAGNNAKAGKDSLSRAWCLWGLGEIVRRLSKYGEAAQHFNNALRLFRVWGLGEIARRLSKYEEAAQHFNNALRLFRARAVQKKEGQAWCLWGLGNCAGALSEHKKAAKHFNDSLWLFGAVHDKGGEAWCLWGLGKAAHGLSKYEEAVRHINAARRLFGAVLDTCGEASCLQALGAIEHGLGKYEEAVRCFSAARRLFGTVQDKSGEAWCLWQLSEIARVLSEYDEATKLYNEALQLFGAVRDKRGEASCVRGLGEIARGSSNYKDAAKSYNEALQFFDAIQDKGGKAWCLWGLGEISHRLIDHDEAAKRYNEALQLFGAVQDKRGEASCLWGLGETARMLGEYEEAAQHFKEALPLFRAVQDKSGEASCFWSLGETARMFGEYEEAAQHFKEALPLFRNVQVKSGEASCLWSLGEIARRLRKDEEAAQRYNDALRHFRTVLNKGGEALCLEGPGDLAESNGRKEEAASLWKSALELFQSVADLESTARVEAKLRLL